MRPYMVPRRPSIAEKDEPAAVNWRRGMFRIWLLASTAWIMGWVIHLILYGLQGGFKVVGDVLAIPVLLFGPPIALLIFGFAAAWAFRGFKYEKEATNDRGPAANDR